MSEERFLKLLNRKIAGEATIQELEELEQLLKTRPEWQKMADLLLTGPPAPSPEHTHAAEAAFAAQLVKMQLRGLVETPAADLPARRRKKWIWIPAATLLVAVAIYGGVLLLRQPAPETLATNEMVTPPKARSAVKLPDGTRVWLNASSRLTYNEEYGKEKREVRLTGEAFFDVAELADKPFIVHTAVMDITVLGTAFNVKAYPDDKSTAASLIRGSIAVTIKNRAKDRITLQPDEKLVVDNGITRLETIPPAGAGRQTLVAVNKLAYNPADSTLDETQWMHNKLVFRDESFRELAARMERWYGVTIDITDPQLQEKRLSGSFEQETIEQAIEALTITTPFRFKKTGDKIVIYR
ncbi:FecR family protein [Chitinophaga japonensis]|uniref:FecR family protein n=1 Tax=Chitinophaga japonensis TaxID=104662 RepID=A0A562THX0_CHIJA|nr:FecR domain-containing protein [Chitinophaga japonensis]TWI92320.1 FecR family protein [Chitinophaga japonensis]